MKILLNILIAVFILAGSNAYGEVSCVSADLQSGKISVLSAINEGTKTIHTGEMDGVEFKASINSDSTKIEFLVKKGNEFFIESAGAFTEDSEQGASLNLRVTPGGVLYGISCTKN